MKANRTLEILIPVTALGDIMSGRWNQIPPIPRETARNARAVFGSDNFYILVGEKLECIMEEIQLQQPSATRPEEAALPLVTFFQAMEGLTDSQAVDALRSRIDWKFALHLPVQTPLFDECALCQFRDRMMSDTLRQSEFQKLADRLCELKRLGHQELEEFKCLHVLEVAEAINRTGHLREAICHALEVLALRYPEWLQRIALPHWYGRYTGLSIPRIGDEQSLRDEGIADINYLFEQMQRSGSPEMLELEEIETLDQVRTQYFQKRSQAPPDENESLGFHHCNACTHKAAIRRR